MELQEVISKLQAFANKHNIFLEQEGECGFCRPCVGFLKYSNYVDYNPGKFVDNKYKYILGDYDTRLNSPGGVESYHKHNCLAVLVHDGDYETGLRQLLQWVEHLEEQGELVIEKYDTGNTGMQAVLTGTHSYAIRFK